GVAQAADRAPRSAQRSVDALEAAPLSRDQALVRSVGRLVLHRPAAADVEPQIEIAESPRSAELDLLQDGVRARAQVGEGRIEVTVHRRKPVGGALAARRRDELTRALVEQLDRIDAGHREEL